MTLSFDHAGLSVADLEAALRFYDDAFGLVAEFSFELGAHGIRGVMLRHEAGHRLELFERPGSSAGLQGVTPIEALATRGFGHIAFAARDIDGPFARAVAAGAQPVIEPRPSPEPGVRFAFLADPEGNLVELVERT
jgi:glyoxylase I family protein